MAKPEQDISLMENIKGTSRRLLEANLAEDERLEVWIEGIAGQCLAATDRRVILIKAGVWATGLTGFGKAAKTFMYDTVTTIDCHMGLLIGRLQVTAGGTWEVDLGSIASGPRPTTENYVEFPRAKYRNFQAAANRILQLIERYKGRREGTGGADESVIDRIKKLAELKDAGIISEEDFQATKQRLLGRL